MTLSEDLYALERELAGGDGDTYRRLLTNHAVVVVPGQVMNKLQTVQAMDSSAGWDEFSFDEERCTEINDATAVLTYRFSARRGEDFRYQALMGSVYTLSNGSWKMAFHQQTPLG
jgi:hypothetical protein